MSLGAEDPNWKSAPNTQFALQVITSNRWIRWRDNRPSQSHSLISSRFQLTKNPLWCLILLLMNIGLHHHGHCILLWYIYWPLRSSSTPALVAPCRPACYHHRRPCLPDSCCNVLRLFATVCHSAGVSSDSFTQYCYYTAVDLKIVVFA